MTRVEFYFNVVNKFEKTAELCEKALIKGRQLTVYTQNEAMSEEVTLAVFSRQFFGK
jgi:DNA polymerase-3 subunit chi